MIRAIHYDSEIHTEPERFNPDRFLGLDLTAGECAVNADPSKRDHYAFGAGMVVLFISSYI